jgi:uncharacterized membrane protein
MWVGFLVILVGGFVVVWIGWSGLTGRLPRNYIAGIRTPYALASDERWKAVHRHAGPFLVLGGAATVAGAMALLPFAIAGVLPETFAVSAALALLLVILGSVLFAWQVGVARARRELRE